MKINMAFGRHGVREGFNTLSLIFPHLSVTGLTSTSWQFFLFVTFFFSTRTLMHYYYVPHPVYSMSF